MFGFFIVLVVIALVTAAVALTFVPSGKDGGHARHRTLFGAGAVGVIALVALLLSCVTSVGTKNVGVVTIFGRPTGYLTNGLHFKAPWAQVHEISDAVQTDTYASDPEDLGKAQGGATDTCVHVRIERQAIACVNVSVRWQIKPTGVDYLYRNFKSNQHIQDNVVLRDLQQAMNAALGNYDPLALDANGNNTNPSLTTYAEQVQTQMRSELSQWIDVQSVIVPFLSYDSATQSKVQQLLQQIALTRVAVQAEQTAKAQAAANKALAASVSNDPNVLVSKCLDILKEAVDKGMALPAGFSCFGPTNTSIAVK